MDDIYKSITSTIATAQGLPNSKERNKVISKLEDAAVWAKTANNSTSDTPNTLQTQTSANCTCPMPGVRDRDCKATIHK